MILRARYNTAVSKPQSSRRDFLSGKAAASAVAASAGQGLLTLQANLDREFLLQLSRRAMACDFQIQFPANREQDITPPALEALDLIERIEDQLTVYRDDSEVLRVNRLAASEPVRVEPPLFGLYQLVQRLHEETGGAFDATSGALSKVWGFSRREGRLPSEDEIENAKRRVGFQHVELNADSHTIQFARPDVEINFNSSGKGYALDRAAESLDAAGVADYVFHGGRSSVFARGRDSDGWAIGLRHPLRPQQRLAELRLRNEALSTSGSATQFFIHRGKRYGHILDPRTGWPAEGIYSATAIAPTAVEADALSTAFYVMGLEEVALYCERRPDIRALLVCSTERGGEVALYSFNLGQE